MPNTEIPILCWRAYFTFGTCLKPHLCLNWLESSTTWATPLNNGTSIINLNMRVIAIKNKCNFVK